MGASWFLCYVDAPRPKRKRAGKPAAETSTPEKRKGTAEVKHEEQPRTVRCVVLR
jgi:hypothetical protein